MSKKSNKNDHDKNNDDQIATIVNDDSIPTSNAAEPQNSQEQEQEQTKKQDLPLGKIIDLENTIKELQTQIAKMKAQEKQLILAAKLNTLKEQEIQNQEFRQFSNQRIIKNLVTTLLNFQRALNFKTDNAEVKNFLVGFKFVYDELIKCLAQEGLKEITATVGDEYNSHKHEALTIINGNSDEPFKDVKHNTIIEVLCNGYELHNRIISTVKVKIVQKNNENQDQKN